MLSNEFNNKPQEHMISKELDSTVPSSVLDRLNSEFRTLTKEEFREFIGKNSWIIENLLPVDNAKRVRTGNASSHLAKMSAKGLETLLRSFGNEIRIDGVNDKESFMKDGVEVKINPIIPAGVAVQHRRRTVAIDFDCLVFGNENRETVLPPALIEWIERNEAIALKVRGRRVRMTLVFDSSDELTKYFKSIRSHKIVYTLNSRRKSKQIIEISYGTMNNTLFGSHPSNKDYEQILPENNVIDKLSLNSFNELIDILKINSHKPQEHDGRIYDGDRIRLEDVDDEYLQSLYSIIKARKDLSKSMGLNIETKESIKAFLNPKTNDILDGKVFFNCDKTYSEVEEYSAFSIIQPGRHHTFWNVGTDVWQIVNIFECFGIEYDEAEIEIIIDQLWDMTDSTGELGDGHPYSAEEARASFYCGARKEYYNINYLKKLIKTIAMSVSDSITSAIPLKNKSDKKVAEILQSLNFTDDDDLLDIALNSGSDNEEEYIATDEEKELVKKSKLEAANRNATINSLPVADDWDLFHPEFSKRAKERARINEVRGASFAHAISISSLMATVSPMTEIRDGGVIKRPVLPYCINIGETATDKTGTGYKPLTAGLLFLSQLDHHSLKKDVSLLRKQAKEDTELKDWLADELGLKSDKSLDDLKEVSTMFLDNQDSSVQGVNRSMNINYYSTQIREHKPEYFNGLYKHPMGLQVDEIAKVLLRIYQGDASSHFPSKTMLNGLKESSTVATGIKRLAGGISKFADKQRTFFGNITLEEIQKAFELEKTSSNGFTGRNTFNFQVSHKFLYDNEMVFENDLDDEMKLLILGSTIINHAIAHKVCKANSGQLHIFKMNDKAKERYKTYTNDQINAEKDKLLAEYPDWASLIENVGDKNWQSCLDITPNIMRFNSGVEIFLSRIANIYPNRKLSDLSPLLCVDPDSDKLLKFAKVILNELEDGFTYTIDDSEDFTLNNILNPVVLDPNGKHDPTQNTDVDEIYTHARRCKLDIKADKREVTPEDLERGISVALNSIRSFGFALEAFRIKSLGESAIIVANKVKAESTIINSESEAGTIARVKTIVQTIEKPVVCKSDEPVTVGKLTRYSRPIKNMCKTNKEPYEEILETMAVLGYLENLGVNCRGAINYKLIKIPKNGDIAQIARAVLA